MTARRPTAGLATRLGAALGLVVVTGVATAWLVASVVAPPLFSSHLHEAGVAHDARVAVHAEEAFRSASVISVALALLAALLVSVAVGVVLTRRVSRSLRPVADAAAEVAGGRYGVRVPPPHLGAEFEHLVTAFNDMASRLDRVEETRRRLLADLAHELRTPVATLAAYLEALEDGVAPLDGESLAVMQAQTGRLARLAHDVSAVSLADEGQRELHLRTVPAAELVGAACAAVADRYAAKGVGLRRAVAEDAPDVRVDVDRLGQVLGNLLDNALRHTPSGGSVTVSAAAEGEWLRLAVADTGSGIDLIHLPHVLERFYRADAARDREHGGSGIGLAIVKALVDAHGGEVTVTSPGVGQGATVAVTLPPADRAGTPSSSS